MGRLPPCDINRFVCLPIFDPCRPSAQGASAPSGTHLPVCADERLCLSDLIGISPPRGSHRAALIACERFRLTMLVFTPRTVTGRKYHYSLCLSSPSLRIAPQRLNLENFGHKSLLIIQVFVHVACRFCRQQRGSKKCAVL